MPTSPVSRDGRQPAASPSAAGARLLPVAAGAVFFIAYLGAAALGTGFAFLPEDGAFLDVAAARHWAATGSMNLIEGQLDAGIASPLWVLLLGVLARLGIGSLAGAALLVSSACTALTAGLMAALLHRLGLSRAMVLLATALFGLSAPALFAAATGSSAALGILLSVAVMTMLLLRMPEEPISRAFLLALLLLLAGLTRLELLLLPLLLLFSPARHSGLSRGLRILSAALALVLAAIVRVGLLGSLTDGAVASVASVCGPAMLLSDAPKPALPLLLGIAAAPLSGLLAALGLAATALIPSALLLARWSRPAAADRTDANDGDVRPGIALPLGWALAGVLAQALVMGERLPGTGFASVAWALPFVLTPGMLAWDQTDYGRPRAWRLGVLAAAILAFLLAAAWKGAALGDVYWVLRWQEVGRPLAAAAALLFIAALVISVAWSRLHPRRGLGIAVALAATAAMLTPVVMFVRHEGHVRRDIASLIEKGSLFLSERNSIGVFRPGWGLNQSRFSVVDLSGMVDQRIRRLYSDYPCDPRKIRESVSLRAIEAGAQFAITEDDLRSAGISLEGQWRFLTNSGPVKLYRYHASDPNFLFKRYGPPGVSSDEWIRSQEGRQR